MNWCNGLYRMMFMVGMSMGGLALVVVSPLPDTIKFSLAIGVAFGGPVVSQYWWFEQEEKYGCQCFKGDEG